MPTMFLPCSSRPGTRHAVGAIATVASCRASGVVSTREDAGAWGWVEVADPPHCSAGQGPRVRSAVWRRPWSWPWSSARVKAAQPETPPHPQA